MVQTNVRKALEDCTLDVARKNSTIKVINMPKLKDIFGAENVIARQKKNSPVTRHEILIGGITVAVLTTVSGKILDTKVKRSVKPSKVPLTGITIAIVPNPQPWYRRTK